MARADPPYPGNAWLHRDYPGYGGEADRAALIKRLATHDGGAAADLG